jgi:hypothetical protein
LDHIGFAFREYDYLGIVFRNEETGEEAVRLRAVGARAAFKDLQRQRLVEFETAICNFYTDLFEFFRRIVQIFLKLDGSEYIGILQTVSCSRICRAKG